MVSMYKETGGNMSKRVLDPEADWPKYLSDYYFNKSSAL